MKKDSPQGVDMPQYIPVRSRPVRKDLWESAKKEFNRLCTYFYTTLGCTSRIASPLVIAPKPTPPYIRFCGDYRRINPFINIPPVYIPHVQYELTKAARYKVYIDLDMANSFHQIPISEEFSQLLSVQTPWSLVRPRFLPEGVGPASGMLQSIVREIFKDFEDWTVVIFDNFLILADDYDDAFKKLQLVLERCKEYRVVLKLKKSFFGVDKVTFFGYEVSHGKWELSQSRKDAINAWTFPRSKKEMQSFLGAALFFHNHIPDYNNWAAPLYRMVHDKFNWNKATWDYDFEKHFQTFKQCVMDATKLYFPDYSLPWVVRCDASEHAVGAVLFQVREVPLDEGAPPEDIPPESTEYLKSSNQKKPSDPGKTRVIYEPIAFSGQRFSEPATRWDTYKREAFAMYHAIKSFQWYLRGKKVTLETDHRNLQWIEVRFPHRYSVAGTYAIF